MKNKAFAVLEVKELNDDARTFKGIATHVAPDRMKDIVEPGGAKFKLPMPFLWQHDSGDPVGWITEATVKSDHIAVTGNVANIPEEGELKTRLDKAWQQLKYKLVRGLSIGFNAIEGGYEHLKNGGIHFKEWEWLELSAVTIPAHQNATITAVKSAYLGASTHNRIASVVANHKGPGTMKTLQEQLKAFEEERQLKMARMGEIKESIDADTVEDSELDEFDTLDAEVSQLDNDIRLKRFECRQADRAKSVIGSGQAPVGIVAKTDKAEDFKGQNYTRRVIAKALANAEQVSPVAIAQNRWGKTSPQLVQIIKADVEGGGTGTSEWGSELASVDSMYTGDFIEYLKEKTIFDQLPLRTVPHNVTIKGQDGAATGNWVGESLAIPASAADFSTVNLTPLKVAALAVVSNELLRDSSPAAEMLVRDALAVASGQKIDATFVSTTAASAGVSPAGMLNGVSAKSASGDDAAAVRADVYALCLEFITAKNASGLAYLMNPSLAKSIALMVNALGFKEFGELTQNGGMLEGDSVYTGDNVDANHMILCKPADIYKIGDLGVEVSISREASIEMDTAPASDSQTPVAATGKVVNMFQTESTAIKVVRPINFAKRRSGAVQYVQDAAYGAATT